MTRHIYCPEGFEPKLYLPERLWKHADAARYFLHIIEATRVFHHRPRTEFNSLKAEYLNNVMGRWVGKPIRMALEETGVVECDHHYREGEKCFGYRLGPNFQDSQFKRNHISAKLLNKLKKHKMYINPKLPVHKHLYRWLTRLDVDYEEAMRSLKSKEEVIDKHVTIEMLADKTFFFTVDDYGRVHTNVSCLSRSLRQFLHFNDSKLVLLDIRNSQPFFFSILLLNYFANKGSIDSFYSFPTRGAGKRGGKNTSITIDILSNLRRKLLLRGDLPKDVNEYISLTEMGRLYEELMDVFDLAERDETKEEFFTNILFCKVHPHKYRTRFRERFPNVDGAIADLKRRDHRRLAHLLQRCESATLIHGVCEKLRLELPEAPLLTIHDCIMTTKPYLEAVRGVLYEEFKALSLFPSFKEHDFTLAA